MAKRQACLYGYTLAAGTDQSLAVSEGGRIAKQGDHGRLIRSKGVSYGSQ